LSECVKRNIEKCVRLINGWIINVMAKIRWYEGEINIHGCKEALALLRRVKKKSIHFWSLNKSFEWLIDITNKLLSTVTLIPSIVFNDSFGVGNCISWVWNEVREVERAMTQKPCLLDQVRVINAILNQDSSPSWPQTFIAHFGFIKCVYLTNRV